jgi:hypothetical protein
MTRRSMLWRVGAAVYALINVGGAVYAIAMGEVPHAALHVVLLVVGAGVWSRYAPARADAGGSQQSDHPSDELSDRFRNLEQSLDAVAIEVERIGEGQRFMTNLLVDQDGSPAAEGSASQPANNERGRSSS